MKIIALLSEINQFAGLISVLILLAVLVLIYLFFRRGAASDISKKIDDLDVKIQENIKYSVTPHFTKISLEVNDLIELAVEVWRIQQRLAKLLPTLPESQKPGLENSVQKLNRYLGKYDIEIIDHTNQKFNSGLNLDVLSVEKDPSITEPIVKETKEPTVMLKGQVVRRAKIILLSN